MLTVESFYGMSDHSSIWNCICECGNHVLVAKSNLINGNSKSCGCLKSNGERLVGNYLEENNINYKKEVSFEDLTSKRGVPLRFDFGIYKEDKLVCLIEYQGEQHYNNRNGFGSYCREYSDNKKKLWCKNKDITLHEIAYFDNIENKLDEIFSIHKLIPCQASKEEGVTTIPQGSTRLVKLQRGSAVHPEMDDEIV